MESRPAVGIRHETKSPWERRAPLGPAHVRTLVQQHGIEVLVQTSPTRVFPDAEYAAAGARICNDLTGCPVILGVKEVPRSELQPDTTYAYFAHVIKGQPQSMPALQQLLDQRCQLIDYERITDAEGRRLIFFGRYAGLAGAIESLWALGHRLADRGLRTPLAELRRPYDYAGVAEAKAHVREVGARLARDGIPSELQPLVVGVTGYGNVGSGVCEMLAELPVEPLPPDRLAAGDFGAIDLRRTIVSTVFTEADMVQHAAPDGIFELQDYYDHPDRYRSTFARYLPWLTVLVHGSYWAPRYPRVVTRDDIRRLYGPPGSRRRIGQPRLQVIGDISCDVKGGVEITRRTTTIEEPVFVYRPDTDDVMTGYDADGPVVMAIDFLPTELPDDASEAFGSALVDLVPHIVRADFRVPFEQLTLPPRVLRALITLGGELTPDYGYLRPALREQLAAATDRAPPRD